jgi:RimJ/RimL family protein N-acetyltransferase
MADDRMHNYLKLPNPYTAEVASKFVTEIGPGAARNGAGLDVAIAENTTGRVVGAAGLHGLKNNAVKAEIGYWVAASEWGNGYATEATRTLARFAFANGARRVQIVCDVANAGSAAVALHAGFRFEGIHRADVDSSHGTADGALFARVAGDPDEPVAPAWPAMTALTDGVVSLWPMSAADWPTVFADQNNPEARHWSLFDAETTEAQARALAEQAPLDWLVSQQARMVISDAATSANAGVMTLRGFGPPGVVNVGYGVLPQFRGRRFTTRALTLLAHWAFGSGTIARLELGCKAGNLPSARAAEAAGFVREGVYAARLRNTDGGYDDEIRFARVRPVS